MVNLQNHWEPTCIRRLIKCYDTGADVAEVSTNRGIGYAKFLGNKEGPHILVCEYLGTSMANLLGLSTFEYHLMYFDGLPEIQLAKGSFAQKGTCWITRKEEGIVWSGERKDLDLIENRADVAKLIVLDTWIRNCDRYLQPRINRNNVFFSREVKMKGPLRLIAMDHTHAFTCGREITTKIAQIDSIKDDKIYGLFPEFKDFVDRQELISACEILAQIPDTQINSIIHDIPNDWEMNTLNRNAVQTFLCHRRDFVAEKLTIRIFPQDEINFGV